MTEGLNILSCSDHRVDYGRIARALGARCLPAPGVMFRTDLDFFHFYDEKYGKTPLIVMPHEKCLAWETKQDNFDNAYCLAVYLKSHGIPAASVEINDGRKPNFRYKDGLVLLGRNDIVEKVDALIDNSSVDWRFAAGVKATAVTIGHNFASMARERVIRFTSHYVGPDTVDKITHVIDSHRAGNDSLPLYFSSEVGRPRRHAILDLFAARRVPVFAV